MGGSAADFEWQNVRKAMDEQKRDLAVVFKALHNRKNLTIIESAPE